MAEYKSFVDMAPAEAEAYLAQFLAETPAALERLRAECGASGGPSRDQLDLSPEFMEPLWEWALPRFAWREGFVPPEQSHIPAHFGIENLEPPDELPSWFFHPSSVCMYELSTPTLWLIDGLARYVGEAVVARVPVARWGVGSTRPGGRSTANQPVIKNVSSQGEVAPTVQVTALAANWLRPWGQPGDLPACFDAVCASARQVSSATSAPVTPTTASQPEESPLEVLEHDHPEFSIYISIDDEVAHEQDEAIDQLVLDLEARPEVRRAHREDREVLLVSTDASVATVEEWLAQWTPDPVASPPTDAADRGGSLIDLFVMLVRTQLVAPLESRGFEHSVGPIDARSRSTLTRPRPGLFSRLGRRRAQPPRATRGVEFSVYGPLAAVSAELPQLAAFTDQDDEVHLFISYDPGTSRLHYSGGPHRGADVRTESDLHHEISSARAVWLGSRGHPTGR